MKLVTLKGKASSSLTVISSSDPSSITVVYHLGEELFCPCRYVTHWHDVRRPMLALLARIVMHPEKRLVTASVRLCPTILTPEP